MYLDETPDSVSGSKVTGRSTKGPKTYGGKRICAHAGCKTKLSSYNKSDTCFRHWQIRFPRTRGKFTKDE